MAECILAWVCIIVAAFTQEPMWAVASALFAVALHLAKLAKGDHHDG